LLIAVDSQLAAIAELTAKAEITAARMIFFTWHLPYKWLFLNVHVQERLAKSIQADFVELYKLAIRSLSSRGTSYDCNFERNKWPVIAG
jgi:hypothetical protein